MASNIDPTKPVAGVDNPLSVVRTTFGIIKSEIESLQASDVNIEQRIDDLEAALTSLTARVAALEAAATPPTTP